ncbi:MAG: HAD-IIB family hydrolase [Erysipelotrichaceae bacterium]|nr:HAD-IIB family hydrolase [Erysipelotrichaceae bacterium]
MFDFKNVKAVAADIDMTLTAKGQDLPEATVKAFQILHDHGILLGLGTGRELNDRLKNQAKEWHLDYEFDFLIGMNGGMISDRFHEGMWCMDLMTTEQMKEILTWMMPLVDKYEISINAEGGGNNNAMNIHGELISSMIRRGFKFDDRTGDIDGFCERPCFKLLFRTTPDVEKLVRERFAEKFADHWQIISTFPGTVEIMEKGISKGSGLLRFAERNNIDPKQIIAFGDNENDNSMLEASGWGVCLKGGGAGTLAIADDVTEFECLEGGVGHYLFEHIIKPMNW